MSPSDGVPGELTDTMETEVHEAGWLPAVIAVAAIGVLLAGLIGLGWLVVAAGIWVGGLL